MSVIKLIARFRLQAYLDVTIINYENEAFSVTDPMIEKRVANIMNISQRECPLEYIIFIIIWLLQRQSWTKKLFLIPNSLCGGFAFSDILKLYIC